MPQDVRSATGVCLIASLITAVTLTTYQQTAGILFSGRASIVEAPLQNTGQGVLDKSCYNLPVREGEGTENGEEMAVSCLSGGAFIDMEEGEEYEAARNLLARLISAEVGDQSYICQVAFGAMVVNRAKSAQFPDSLAGVIYQAGAFSSVADRRINAAPTERALHAARDALSGSDPGSGALYWFRSEDKTRMEQYGYRVTVTLGDICFYK
ncbi:MAG: hypothetical protein GX303_05530 [Clostridiales bacterium]|nr:hypothetical protein [Clostridiales bacterium]